MDMVPIEAGARAERRSRAFLPYQETLMNKPDNLTEKGKAAGASLRKAAKQEELKIEAQKGSELRKGEKRFEERSKSSDGKSAGEKQR